MALSQGLSFNLYTFSSAQIWSFVKLHGVIITIFRAFWRIDWGEVGTLSRILQIPNAFRNISQVLLRISALKTRCFLNQQQLIPSVFTLAWTHWKNYLWGWKWCFKISLHRDKKGYTLNKISIKYVENLKKVSSKMWEKTQYFSVYLQNFPLFLSFL